MRTILADMAEETIKKYRMLARGETVLAAVSGGADSVCMLHFLSSIAGRYGITLAAAHVDHMLRGSASEGDSRFVGEFCGRLGVKLFSEAYDVRAAAAKCRGNIEETAREIRYGFFEKTASACGADRIAVAHNRNDRAETVLMNIIRGAGIDGLKGIGYLNGRIIRPLLDVPRKYIEEYCRANSLEYRTDSSNFEDIYARNRIRNKLIPEIDREFGADMAGSLCRLSDIAAADSAFLEEEARKMLEGMAVSNVNGGMALDRTAFAGVHEALANRIIRQCISKVKGNLKGIGNVHTAAAADFAANGRTGSQIQLPGGVRLTREYDKLIFYCSKDCNSPNISCNDKYPVIVGDGGSSISSTKVSSADGVGSGRKAGNSSGRGGNAGNSSTDGTGRTAEDASAVTVPEAEGPTAGPAAAPGYCVSLRIPGTVHIADTGIMITAEIVKIGSGAAEADLGSIIGTGGAAGCGKGVTLPVTEYFDCSIADAGINIRNRKEGDVFRPIGTGGSCTLRRYMNKRRIPAYLRNSILLAVSGNDVVWVMGDRISEDYKVKEGAAEAVRLTAERPG